MDKKFDIILSNPPWGKNIHYEFTQKYLDIADTVISIMPNSIIKRDTKHFKKYKEAYNDYLYDVEEIDSKNFEGTNMQNCCIFCFSQDKEDLNIKYIEGKEEHIGSILEKDYSGFTDYEKEIVKYLYNEKPNLVPYIDLRTVGKPKSVKNDKELLKKYVDITLSKLPDNKAYLICNAADGSMSANYFTSKVGQIFDNKDDLREFLINRGGVSLHYMYFDSVKAAMNCKHAMQRPLLRFSLIQTQTDQHLNPGKHYKYIPDIDWEDERVKTDEGLLEVCGCPKDKCKEYANYCEKIINKKNLHIKYIDGKEETISGILEKDYSGFTDYEKDIVKYLYNEKPNIVDGCNAGGPHNDRKGNLSAFIEHILNKLPDNKAYLVISAADGSMKAKYFSSKVGQIFDNKEDFKDFLYERGGKIAHYMWFDSVKAAENAKAAMQRPVLRFILARLHNTQGMVLGLFKYIPGIDWEDERVKTDEGLLEVCGCPKDKCKEYADYCRKVIEEKDRK